MSSSAFKPAIGQPFMELAEVGSTNIYAMELLQTNMAGHGSVFFAHSQVAGKGQRGKGWIAEPGNNITMSVVLDPSFLLVSEAFHLSVMVALACYNLFCKYAGSETSVKWPNDIYWHDRKAGGILIETLVRGTKWQGAVAGIGLNINQVHFPPQLKNPVSLKQITGKQFDTVLLAKELCVLLEQQYSRLQKGGFREQLYQYNQYLFKKDQSVKLKKGNIISSCIIRGVNEYGHLLAEGGTAERYDFGDVEWIL